MIVPVNAFEFPRVKNNENALPTTLQVTPDVARDDHGHRSLCFISHGESMEYDHEVLKKVRCPKSFANLKPPSSLVEKNLFQGGTKQHLVILHLLVTMR